MSGSAKYHYLPLVITGVAAAGARRGYCCSRPSRHGWPSAWCSGEPSSATTIGLHATWLVNSATHLCSASRRFETRDDSRNNWWVAILTGGEGWHNNHHAHPVSARHGLAWYEFDINYYGIWLLSKIGLAEKIQIAKYDKTNPKPAGVL